MIKAGPVEIPCVINGKAVTTGKTNKQLNPSNHASAVAVYQEADAALIGEAIEGALAAKVTWEDMPWVDRAAIFLRAADLIAGKYRYKIMAATMLGQGKNVWQAEIDAAAEICDFFRFGVAQVAELYSQQPAKHAPGVWNKMEYRPLEGFVLAVSPFNFTAIGGNLPGAPALVGNVVIWKPSPMAVLSNYIVYQILEEAGLPAGVIQFTPGPAEEIVKTCTDHRKFASLHFTGSTYVFRQLWKQIVNNIDNYVSYPRIVGETGGKNFHLVHPSANVTMAVHESIRAAFEYQGQKCSALSRLYVPASLWNNGFKDELVKEIKSITLGPVEDFKHFMGPVISKGSFDKSVGFAEAAKKEGGIILAGGKGDDSKGYYVEPTLIQTENPRSTTMVNEIFGPVLTAYVYDDSKPDFWKTICAEVDGCTEYALTGAVFAKDRQAVVEANSYLRNASGMFYVQCKCTGAVVGQQPFGGGRASGTNDKAGSISIFYRFVNQRTTKENMIDIDHFSYPHNA
jgi:1-pyrroline-5-carboxylate dehydrogenase